MTLTAAAALSEMVEQVIAEPDRSAGLTATYEFELTGEGGGDWHVVFDDGSPRLHHGRHAQPDTTLSMLADDFVALHTGELEGSLAFATGRMRVMGDATLGMRLGQMLRPAGAERTVTPEPIISIASGFMASRYLFTASELGVFERLGEGPASLGELAAAIAVEPRGLRIVVDALVALELLERHDDRYANAPSANMFLTGRSPIDLRPLLRFWDRVSYPRWSQLADAVRANTGVAAPPGEDATVTSEGVEAITAIGTRSLSAAYEFERHRAVLDVGGGTGSYLTAVLRHRPRLRGTLVEQPAVAAVARHRLAADPAGARVEVIAGDLFNDPLPTGHDVVLVANVVHVFTPELNVALLRRLRECVDDTPGTRLLLVDTWTDEDRSSPLRAALIAGEYLTANGGDVYSVGDVRRWLDETGWSFAEHRQLIGPSGLIIARPGTAAG